jgi:hypothetical protein
VFDFLGDVLGAYIGTAAAERLRKGGVDRRGRLPCALRVLEGDQAGLRRRWRHGKAAVSPGRIDFFPRRPLAREITIPVHSVSRLHERQPRGAEAWWVSPRSRIVEVRTATAILEWAIISDHVRGALTEIRKPPGELVAAEV